MNKCNYENEAKTKNVSQPGITLPYMETRTSNGKEVEVFALPGRKECVGREKAEAMALRHSLNPCATFDMKPKLTKLADKTVNRIKAASRDGGHVTMGF